MGFAAAGGLALQAGGAYLQKNAADNELAKQGYSQNAYQGAYNQLSGDEQVNEKALQAYLGTLSDAHFADYDKLAAALGNGQARGAAGATAAAGNDARIGAALAQAPGALGALNLHPDAGVSGSAAGDWANKAQAFYQPAITARRGLSNQQASARGQRAYDTGAQANFQQSETINNRLATTAEQNAQLMRQFYGNQLQGAQDQYRYNGPSNGYYNEQLIGQGLGALGGGAVSAGAYQKPKPASPTSSDTSWD